MDTPIRVIRKKCLRCSNNSNREIEKCPIKDCPLYPYRFGKRPKTARKQGRIVD